MGDLLTSKNTVSITPDTTAASIKKPKLLVNIPVVADDAPAMTDASMPSIMIFEYS